MHPVGSLVTLKTRFDKVRARVTDVVPDIDRTYYALSITSRTHPRYQFGTEVLVPVDSDAVTFRSMSKPLGPKPKEECIRGHKFTENNTYYEVGTHRTGVRRCRECLRTHKNLWYKRKVGNL